MDAMASAAAPPGGGAPSPSSGSVSNPRKFSEKIALHKQREAEEKKEFEKMMSELKAVKGPTSGGGGNNPPQPQVNPITSSPSQPIAMVRIMRGVDM